MIPLRSGSWEADRAVLLKKIEKFLEIDLTNGESVLYFILMLRLSREV